MKQPSPEQAGCFRLVYSPPGRHLNDHCFIEDAAGPVLVRDAAFEDSTVSMESPCVIGR